MMAIGVMFQHRVLSCYMSLERGRGRKIQAQLYSRMETQALL